ncbi:MAG: NERD domain-containing protein [Rhodospirillaceae bacterium]|nr:NERD domain-containing protein [Rhodospirillaceae bacterium]
MILKKADPKDDALAALNALLATAPQAKHKLIEQEIRIIKAGQHAENEAAYHLDFALAASKVTAVIHDLRIVLHDGRTAQIDHLVIHRTNKFYVLETKSFSHGVKITKDGEFLRWNDFKRRYEGLPSPLEQNERHVTVLTRLLASAEWPEPVIKPYVMISPKAKVIRPDENEFDTSRVVKADQFISTLQTDLEQTGLISGLLGMARMRSVEDIGRWLCGCHKPAKPTDYAAKFGLEQKTA